jgi:putative membrane protein
MRKIAMAAGAFAAMTASAMAQDGARSRASSLNPESIGSTIVFGLVGIFLATLGFKVFDWLIKADIEKEIFEHKNMAAALLSGAFILGISLIIAMTIHS